MPTDSPPSNSRPRRRPHILPFNHKFTVPVSSSRPISPGKPSPLTPEIVSAQQHLAFPWKGVQPRARSGEHEKERERAWPASHSEGLGAVAKASRLTHRPDDSVLSSLNASTIAHCCAPVFPHSSLPPLTPTAGMLHPGRQFTFSMEIDFTQPDETRQLEIRVGGRSVFVDPKYTEDVSPVLTNFLVREFVAGKRKVVDIRREDISYEDIVALLRVLHPVGYNVFGKSVDQDDFLCLARISDRFKVPKLRAACELFVAHLNLDDHKISTEVMCDFLIASYKYNLMKPARIRLLEGLIGRGTVSVGRKAFAIPGLAQMIMECLDAYQKHELHHGDLLNEVKLRMPCRTCRIEQPNVPLPAVKGELSTTGIPAFTVCSKCRSTLCCACVLKPCKKAIEEFVTKFAERFHQTQSYCV